MSTQEIEIREAVEGIRSEHAARGAALRRYQAAAALRRPAGAVGEPGYIEAESEMIIGAESRACEIFAGGLEGRLIVDIIGEADLRAHSEAKAVSTGNYFGEVRRRTGRELDGPDKPVWICVWGGTDGDGVYRYLAKVWEDSGR